MIPGNVIDEAAAWIAGQQREPHEAEQLISLAVRRSWYLERAQAMLMQKATEGQDLIGMCVPCEGQAVDGLFPMATVHVESDRIFGYLPGEVRPSFIWPPDLAVRLRAKWESEQV